MLGIGGRWHLKTGGAAEEEESSLPWEAVSGAVEAALVGSAATMPQKGKPEETVPGQPLGPQGRTWGVDA